MKSHLTYILPLFIITDLVSHGASAALVEWDFNGLSQAPTMSTITTPVENNTFGAGVTIGDFTLNANLDDRDSAFQRDRAEQGVHDNSPPTMEFTVTIDDTVMVDLSSLDFRYGFFDDSGVTNSLTPSYSLSFNQGSGTNTSATLPTGSGSGTYEEFTDVTSSLSGLTGLTDTAVTFTWTFTSAEGRNYDLAAPGDAAGSRAHYLDNVTLTGTASAIPEPSSLVLIGVAFAAMAVFRKRR